MPTDVAIPPDALLSGASRTEWRTALEIRHAARLDDALHRNAVTPKLLALERRGELVRQSGPHAVVYRRPRTQEDPTQ